MHNSAKIPLAHAVQQKNAGIGLRKCLYMRSCALVFT